MNKTRDNMAPFFRNKPKWFILAFAYLMIPTIPVFVLVEELPKACKEYRDMLRRLHKID